MARILIIDDDPDIVESMKVVLESAGHEVITTSGEGEGLKMAKTGNPNLIILDVMMEEVDTGFNICRALKKDSKYKHIPILMLTAIKDRTGFGFKEEAGDEAWLPVDDYVDKPIKPEELLSKVNFLINKK